MTDLRVSFPSLLGYQDGIYQALTYLNAVHAGYLEILNTQPSDNPLIISQKQKVLADIESLSKLEKEYNQKLEKLEHKLLDSRKKYKIDPSQPFPMEE